MNPDLDDVLRAADPARGTGPDDALLARVRERVDAERRGIVPSRRNPWPRRVVLTAAAAAVLTAVPVVVSALHDGDDGRSLLPPAVAADGQITCISDYTAAVAPEDATVRLLPDQLPDGWSYSQIYARQDDPEACGSPSLVALREDPTGVITGRVAVSGPVDVQVDQGKLVSSVPDTLFGHPARRFDVTQEGIEFHRWVWTDDQGAWTAEASGVSLSDARSTLARASIDGSQVGWHPTADWTLVHLREGAPHGAVPGGYRWTVELTGPTGRRQLEVDVSGEPEVSFLVTAGVGERVTTVAGHPAVLSHPRGDTTPVFVELAPGTVAWSYGTDDELPAVEEMIGSLRQVPVDDPRIEQYDTD